MFKNESIKEKLKKYDITIYTDFDGTISSKDIGDDFFKRYGEFEKYHKKLFSREISIYEYWVSLCNSLNKNVELKTFIEYVKEVDIDPYFTKFIQYCNSLNIKVSVISDGFDAYIKPFLNKYGLDSINVFSNKLIFTDGQLPQPYYPGASESCKCLCASCKRNVIISNTPPENIIVYIGDGYSDFCAAEHSDIVFAKNALATYCNEKRIPHYPFGNFFDIYYIFEKLIKKNKFKIKIGRAHV